MDNPILASDMDGTFIPLQGNDQNRHDLMELALLLEQQQIELVYVTGRHLEIVLDAIESEGLPRPNWLICDVGTSIYQRGGKYEYILSEAYVNHLHDRSGELNVGLMSTITAEEPVELQEEAKQGRFKRSFYCDADRVGEIASRVHRLLRKREIPYHVIESVDPFTGSGLIDLLPDEVTKAHALAWWVAHRGRQSEGVMFAGDSGNDLAALIAGYRAIVVGNAAPELAERVAEHHRVQGWNDRLFLAERTATSGVLDGVQHFLQIS